MDTEFVEYRFDMVTDGIGRDVEPLSDPGVGQAVEEKPGELALAGGEPVSMEDKRGDIGGWARWMVTATVPRGTVIPVRWEAWMETQ